MTIELWQAPLLVMAAILAGYLAYVWVAGRWSRVARLWIKISALLALAAVALVLGYQLLKRAEISTISTVLGVATLVGEVFVGWVTWQHIKELRTAKDAQEQAHQGGVDAPARDVQPS
jgi:hypothetical protein